MLGMDGTKFVYCTQCYKDPCKTLLRPFVMTQTSFRNDLMGLFIA